MDKLDGLMEQGKIGSIIRYDIPGDKFSNPRSQLEFIGGIIQSGVKGNNAPHFDLARPGSVADNRIKQVGEYLLRHGVK